MVRLNEAEQKRHAERMAAPLDWPTYPVCPLKRRTDERPGMEEGLLVAWEDRRTTVFLANMFALKSGPIGEVFGALPQIQYDSIEAIIADGWEVD